MTYDNINKEILAAQTLKNIKEYLDSTKDLFQTHNNVSSIIVQRVYNIVREFDNE
jgi:hypothetical protein|tara:strand:- start:59 stop:223 length:165 start_codon:yes stop_codon:yes gene_type:complete